MSQTDRYAKTAALRIQRAWREGRARLGSAPRNSIRAAERALRARRRRRILVRLAVPVVASSVGLGVPLLVWLSLAHRPPRSGMVAGDRASDQAGDLATGRQVLFLFGAAGDGEPAPGRAAPGSKSSLGAGDQVFAPRTASVGLGDAGGTQLRLDPGGHLTVLEAGATRRFSLRRGAVSARVHKLAVGERFIIETPDAEIEVHGTAFRVTLGAPESVPCAGPGATEAIATRVAVSEGVVSVKWSGDEQRLLPGDEWPPRCAPANVSQVGPVAVDPPARAHAPALHRRNTASAGTRRGAGSGAVAAQDPHPRQREPPASLLEAQNDLFLSAVRARRRGRPQLALALFNRFIDEYPEASLFESALAHKMRLLAATSDRSGAATAARQYLERFSNGFARDEARTLLGASDRP